MTKVKIVQKGFETYTGPLAHFEFKNGVSVEPIPAYEVDRISASVKCVTVDEDGAETVAGVAERLVTHAQSRAAPRATFQMQTHDQKVEEEVGIALKELSDDRKLYTEAELDEVIDEGGISALREVARIWGVKAKAIPVLRKMVLDAQEEYLKKSGKRLEDVVKTLKEVSSNARSESDQVPDENRDEVLVEAAVTGDLSAAINTAGE